jgi:hypothetical protein
MKEDLRRAITMTPKIINKETHQFIVFIIVIVLILLRNPTSVIKIRRIQVSLESIWL